MNKEEMTDDMPVVNPADMLDTIDPYAMTHTRQMELDLGGTGFVFRWNRINVPELIMACIGNKENPDDTTVEAIQRVIINAVDVSQKGLLTDLFRAPGNSDLPDKLAEMFLKKATVNETRIGKVKTKDNGDTRIFTVPLITDGKEQVFEFTSDRNKRAEYKEEQENPDINNAEAIYNYLSNCLPEDRRNEFALIVYDIRNFSLPLKIYRRVTDFLSRAAVSIGELKIVSCQTSQSAMR